MKEKYKLLYLILIMIFSVSLVGLFTYYQLYTTAIGKERAWLQNTAKSQARLLEAVARFDAKHSAENYAGGAAAATLSQIADSQKHYKGFGETGEFSLAGREGENIVFLLKHRHSELDKPEPIPFSSNLAEPMKRALAGESGTMIGADYRGVNVLAAYEPVAILDIGIVAKMDITEIQRPFIVAATKSTLLALILITVGSYFFMRLINPIIKKLQYSKDTLAKERKNLEKRVDARTNELRKSLVKIEKTNIELILAKQAQSKFLSSMSHELRTPLNAIMGYTDLLNVKAYGSLNEEQSGFVKEITSSGKHLLSFINDLLDVAKIDANAMTLQPEEISPEDFIGAAVRMLSLQFRKKNIKVETFIDPGIDVVTADVRRCKQIMINLLSNAAKYTNESGRVAIRVTKEDDLFIKVEVSDTGIGVAKDDIGKIFSEFYQADKVRDEQLGGTGIGLALTHRLVKMHGGNIGVLSDLGKGSTFWFTLPYRQPQSLDVKTSREDLPPGAINLTNRRILIVEDNEVNLKMMLKILSTSGPEIAVANNGVQAIEITKSFNPELILMDIRLPVMDGMEATKRLRNIPAFFSTPIISLSAGAGKEAESDYAAAGCTAHLSKPIETDELFKVLEKYLTT
ncbi:MAG: ATP-binding protein [Candidatus Anammoxibacter sp.]